MERTSLCKNTANLYKVGGGFFYENDSGPHSNRQEFLGKYGEG
ncbi:hypothetical protein T11_13610 [Trichinella zimbabwensis]|uniref:Uncharacterized protein n=1 Tax=Trichinella zimbabwensis TaxID=268475 RepID=A0A0V1FL46_9BILA|nr:hypothetical protein T11_13610 [Trichinella zimbabwensis]